MAQSRKIWQRTRITPTGLGSQRRQTNGLRVKLIYGKKWWRLLADESRFAETEQPQGGIWYFLTKPLVK